MGDGTEEGVAVDNRISSIFVLGRKAKYTKLKALGYTSHGKYVGFLNYPVDEATSSSVISTLILHSTQFHTTEGLIHQLLVYVDKQNIIKNNTEAL